VQANAVFVSMSQQLIEALHQLGWHFYSFIGAGGVRLMCSWATEEADIEALVEDVRICNSF
jgi:threonine aldolase